jgi:hypothetical protein
MFKKFIQKRSDFKEVLGINSKQAAILSIEPIFPQVPDAPKSTLLSIFVGLQN